MGAGESRAGQGLSLIFSALVLVAGALRVDISEDAWYKTEGLRQPIKLFIGIPSSPQRGEFRNAARETWIPVAKASHAVAVRFFCYVNTTDRDLAGLLKDEQNEHRDMIIVTPDTLKGQRPVSERTRLSRLALDIFITAFERFETEYIMRAADYAYMNIPVIMRLLQEQKNHGPMWYGHAVPGVVLKRKDRRPEYKELWETTVEPPVIPQYMDGAGAILSANVVEALLVVERLVGLHMIQNADAAIGLWLNAFQMRYINDTKAGCSVMPFQPSSEGSDDAEWSADASKVFCLHHKMPLAVVHPLTPDLMRKVFLSATACRDTLSYN